MAAVLPSFAFGQRLDRQESSEEKSFGSRTAVGVNLGDLLFLGTVNGEAQVSLARNWSLGVGARYNNWTYNNSKDNQFQERNQSYYISARWWPWYIYSGWWVGSKLQYQEYNRGGIFHRATEEGDAFGASLGAGYSLHLNRWLNLDFGMYGWGGWTVYKSYVCPRCGRKSGEGGKVFILPDEIRLSLTFVL